MSKSIVIVFHSGYGHTRKIAEAVAEGSRGRLLAIDADGNLPDDAWDKLAAAFTNSASVAGDKQTALYTMFTLAQQHGMAWVGAGLMPSNAKSAQRDDVNYLSSFAGLATATPSDASPDEMVPGDIRTAILFGQRVRATAERLA
jgi:multimeric flavodoxin WrbA